MRVGGLHSKATAMRTRLLAGVPALTCLVWAGPPPDSEVIFRTGFEVAEGYTDADLLEPLRGQVGWVGEGSGGTGLVWDFFAGHGQQAYIGFLAPAPKDGGLSLWRPLELPDPDPARPVWRFSTLMQVVDSTNGEYDDFRWSAYNKDGGRLFTVSFDNATTDIRFALDSDEAFTASGFTFSNDAIYWLDVLMNFGRNNWTAMLNGFVVVDSRPLTTGDLALNLGDFGPVWTLTRQGNAGDNFLLFDEYEVRVEPGLTIPPTLELLGLNAAREFELYLHGERGLDYSIDVSSDLRTWTSLGTNHLADGFLYFVDTTASGFPASFYRAREVAP